MDQALQRYDQARAALQAAQSVDEVKDIRDRAQAMAIYARQAKDNDLIAWATEIKIRAERRCGEMLQASAADGTRATQRHHGKGIQTSVTPDDTRPTLPTLGISRNQSSRWQQLARMPLDAFDAAVSTAKALAGGITTTFVLRQQRRAARAETVATRGRQAQAFGRGQPGDFLTDLDMLLTAGRTFQCLYADPPWAYENQGTRASTSNHYTTMSLDALCALPIGQLAAPQCHLHLWTTNAFLFDCPRLFDAWGFEFKSSFVWVKPSLGMGNYWRNSHELLLLGVRGGLTAQDKSLLSWYQEARTTHSAKPEAIRDRIERLSPGPYLELFGRSRVPGWVVWGNECVPSNGRLFKEGAPV